MRLDNSLIRELPPFSDMDDAALTDVLGAARSVLAEKGDVIFSQDVEAQEFFLLLDGLVRVVKLTPDGEQVIPRHMASGELFGIAPALGLATYPASAIAVVDCILLKWPNAMWHKFVKRHSTFATNTYRIVGKRLAETQQQLVEMATRRVEQRVANALLKLANQTGHKAPDGILIDFPITRQDISDMTGTTLHTVSRLLSRWENDGWIKCSRQRITLVEGHKLVLVTQGRTDPSG